LGQDWDLPAEPGRVDGAEFAAHTHGAIAERMLAGPGPRARQSARGLAWDAVADLTGAPIVVPEILDPPAARRAARLVDEAGGATAVARRWPDDAHGPAAGALFTPFGQLDEDERAAVIRTIRRSGGHGDQVWAAALGAATFHPDRHTPR